jgi:hypothetical protein
MPARMPAIMMLVMVVVVTFWSSEVAQVICSSTYLIPIPWFSLFRPVSQLLFASMWYSTLYYYPKIPSNCPSVAS